MKSTRRWLLPIIVAVAVLSVILLPAGQARAAVPLVYSGWESLNGASSGAPSTTSWGPRRLDVFVRATNNSLQHKWYANGWLGWETLGSPPGGLASDPGAVAWSPGRIDVFAAGVDKQLWHKWYASGWSRWEPLGGVLTSAPTVASPGSGRLDVFVRGTDNQLWHKRYQGRWSGWEALGGNLTSAPAAISSAPGRIDVFVAGPAAHLYHKWYTTRWFGWEPLGGVLVGAPGVASTGSGRLDVYVRGTDDNVWSRSYASGWSGWQVAIAGPIASGPSAVSWAAGRVDVFASRADQRVYHAFGLAGDPYLRGATGYDVSWPQCGGMAPPSPFSLAVVGVGGRDAFSYNSCLFTEVSWFGSATVALYLKLSSPEFGQPRQGDTGPAGTCSATDALCRGYNYGWNLVTDAYRYAASQRVFSGLWWLDVEGPPNFTPQLWGPNTAANSRVISGAINALTALGRQAGIYSNSVQWPLIAGTYAPLLPTWQARPNSPPATQYCSTSLFTTGPVWLVQYGNSPFDRDLAC
jgi:hypothetical protein